LIAITVHNCHISFHVLRSP